MKRGLILISLILTITCCEKIDTYPSLDNYRLKKILNFGSSTDSEPDRFVDFEYNKNGNLIKKSHYDYPNTQYGYFVYVYENDLLKKEEVYEGQVGNLRLGHYSTYEYENNKLIKEDLFYADGTLNYSKHYEYIGDNLVNRYKFDEDLGIHHQRKYTYNEFDLVILEESYMYYQQLSSFIKYYYDNNRRLTKMETFDSDNTIINTEEKKYVGASTLPSEELYYEANGTLRQRRLLLYDNLANLTEVKIIHDQVENTLFRKKYNGKLLIEHIQYDPVWGYIESSVTRYKYELIK